MQMFIIVVKCYCKFEGCFNDLDAAIVLDDKMKNKCKYDLYQFYLTKTCIQSITFVKIFRYPDSKVNIKACIVTCICTVVTL